MVSNWNDSSKPENVSGVLLMSAVRTGAISAFVEGFLVPWNGYTFMRQHRGLWRYGWIPVGLNLLISVAMLLLFYYLGSLLFESWLPGFPEGLWGYFLKIIAVIGGILLLLGVGIALWFLLGAIFCGFFYSRLARQAELLIGTPPSVLREVPLMYEIVYSLRTVSLLLLVNFGLLLAHLVPIVGSTLGVAAAFYFDFYFMGWEYFDYPLALRAKSYSEKKRFVKAHRFHTLGMGAAVLSFTFIPILGAILLTTSVVGSVLLHHRLNPA